PSGGKSKARIDRLSPPAIRGPVDARPTFSAKSSSSTPQLSLPEQPATLGDPPAGRVTPRRWHSGRFFAGNAVEATPAAIEGAVQNGWSVAQMREQRWETLGKVAADKPRPEDVISSDTDEDFEPARTHEPVAHSVTGEYGEVQGPRPEGPDFGDDEGSSSRG